jgi:hypothetical protein
MKINYIIELLKIKSLKKINKQTNKNDKLFLFNITIRFFFI